MLCLVFSSNVFRFATEIFHGIQEEVILTASRSNKLKMRLKQIEATVPSIQKAVLAQTNHIQFAYTGGMLCFFLPVLFLLSFFFIV